ncbi:heavy metal translocating P-type ATPase [Clostridium estertheticum]|uniref:heavy metal translocating P-type ATPase n=1 Tax=Clostridium estertheticum TaxID=238834 RepID=UPI001C0C8A4D|nr:heavy metal translocating P-type ATPase [Clostridium estertheticum]MBU3155454.1 cadmium-translocating P-type ATPase [Clostridium estertheticum]MBU3199538.1 cadmium-translocating P-type ATPase [Clostridium estertheticum]
METIIKREFILEGLCCVNCANKIETQCKKLDGVSDASINFINKNLVIQFQSEDKILKVIDEAKKIVKRIEPDVNFIESVKHEGHSHNHSHDHGHGGENQGNDKNKIIRFSVGVAIFLIAVILKLDYWFEFSLFLISYLLIGGEVLMVAIKNILRGEVFDENFLMALATVGAFSIGQFPEGVGVMLFYQVGEFFQDMAVNKSTKSISALMDIRPDYANKKINDEIVKVDPEEVHIGDIIIVKPGEKVPLDGSVIEGNSLVDSSALTGESVPREVNTGDEILAGCINKNGLLTIEVKKEFGESTLAKILDLVKNASSKKAPTENFITKFARYYTPIVVISAVVLALVPPLLIPGATFSQWIYRALVFLVVSCPCALVISIPLGFFGGIGGASKNGILVKGGNYLEALNSVEMVVFDKTGTLTKGVFKVTEMHIEGDINEEELLEYAASVESYSNHPIATSILKAYGKEVNKKDIEDVEEIAGKGIKAKVKGKYVLAGNAKLMDSEKISYTKGKNVGSIIYVAIDNIYVGSIIISDEVKDDSISAIKKLKSMGVKKIVMLTGDNKDIANNIGKVLGVDEVYSELLPQDKVEKLEKLQNEKSPKGKIVFVGDGINDAPVLARADIGIAMGGVGSDAAIEAADIVIMTDEPSKIALAIKIAQKTKKIVMQNIVFALGVKAIILILAVFGIANMWEAVFGDVGVALIAVLNSMRAMKS